MPARYIHRIRFNRIRLNSPLFRRKPAMTTTAKDPLHRPDPHHERPRRRRAQQRRLRRHQAAAAAPGRREPLRQRLVGLLPRRDRARRRPAEDQAAGSSGGRCRDRSEPRRRLLLPAGAPQRQRAGRGPRGRAGAGRGGARDLPVLQGGPRQHRSFDQRPLNGPIRSGLPYRPGRPSGSPGQRKGISK